MVEPYIPVIKGLELTTPFHVEGNLVYLDGTVHREIIRINEVSGAPLYMCRCLQKYLSIDQDFRTLKVLL